MYNDFVIVGPAADPAGVKGATDSVAALRTLAGAAAPFASRGDDSGTNKAELILWREAGNEPSGDWFRETGKGMGTTLNNAAAMEALTPKDPTHWLHF